MVDAASSDVPRVDASDDSSGNRWKSSPLLTFPCKSQRMRLIICHLNNTIYFRGSVMFAVVSGTVTVAGYTATEAASGGEVKWFNACSCNIGPLLHFTTKSKRTDVSPETTAAFSRKKLARLRRRLAVWVDEDAMEDVLCQLQEESSLMLVCPEQGSRRDISYVHAAFPAIFEEPTVEAMMGGIQVVPGLNMLSPVRLRRGRQLPRSFTVPNDWIKVQRSIVKLTTNDEELSKNSLVVMVVGNKNTGKSTFIRYVLNSFLSLKSGDRSSDTADSYVKLYYVDVDTGQSEFTLPGCVSLTEVREPLIGPPFAHLTPPECALFFGDLHPGDQPTKYLASITGVMAYLRCLDVLQNQLVLVNCNGWIKGLGLELLRKIFDIVSPDMIVEVAREQTTQYRSPNIDDDGSSNDMFRSLQQWLSSMPDINCVTVTSPADQHYGSAPTKSYSNANIREMGILSYFGQCLSPRSLCINSVPPYVVPWKHLGLHLTGATSLMLDIESIMAILNASIVALCTIDESQFGPHINDNGEYPRVVFCEEPLLCVGFGLVRGIDISNHLFYIITPVDPDVLESRVNAISYGSVAVPFAMFEMQATSIAGTELPYVTKISPQRQFDELTLLARKPRMVTRHQKRGLPE